VVRLEAEAIATSCLRLIHAGMNPRSILVLLGNQGAQGPDLFRALDAADVPYEPPREAAFRDESVGRLVLTICRLVSNPHDYVAHRALLGLRRGVGVRACNGIATGAINANHTRCNPFPSERPSSPYWTKIG
jgi:superfamily I DNA/RNA helicase